METKKFSTSLGPSKGDSLDEEDTNPDDKETQQTQEGQENQASSWFPVYAIAIIVVAIILTIAIIAYLIVQKRRQSKISKNNSLQNLREVWATPKDAILNTKTLDTSSNSMTGNTFTNLSSSSTDINASLNSSQMVRDNSRINQFYMNLPYFQHEVDTQDQRISTMMTTNIQPIPQSNNRNNNINQQ